MVLAPLALIGCGDDDDNPGTGGNAGTGGSGTMQGSGGGPAMGSAGSGGDGSCTPSPGLTRTAGQACADSQLVCQQEFTFDPAAAGFADPASIREVQLQGALIPDTSWVTGAYMRKEGEVWKATVELNYKVGEVEHRFYVLRNGEPWNAGTATNVTKATVSCATPVCATNQDPWAAEAKRARPAPPPPADGAPFDWRDAIIYFAFIDRFYNGDGVKDPLITGDDVPPGLNDYMGGDFDGVTKKITEGYFSQLGVNALWLTVPFDNTEKLSPTAPPEQCVGDNPAYVGCYPYTGYHGYWPLDQWPAAGAGVIRTENHFGSEQKLKALVDTAHANGIKIIFDYAMVHVYEDSKLYTSFLNYVKTGVADSLGIDETWFTPKFAVDENGGYIRPVLGPKNPAKPEEGQTVVGVVPVNYVNEAGDTVQATYRDFPAPQLALVAGEPNPEKYLPPGVTVDNFKDNFFECTCTSDETSICNWDGLVKRNAAGETTVNLPTIGERCWFQGYLPHLNYKDDPVKNTSARDYSLDAAVRLAKDMSADGYRLDAVKHIDQAWYTEVRTRIQAEVMNTRPAGERFYMVGETYDFNGRYNLDRFIDPAKMLDGQFDFPVRAQLARAVLASKGSAGPNATGTWKSGMDVLAKFMHSNDNYYGGDAIMSTWIGNHDVGRPIHIAEDSVAFWDEYADGKTRAWTNQPGQPTAIEPYQRLANAFAILMTNPGAPLIYYGDEYGLAGGGDPDNRRPFFLDDGTYPANPSQQYLFDRIKKLAEIRKGHKALRYGTRTTLTAAGDVWIYKMAEATSADEVFVAVNRGDAEATSCGDVPAGAYTNLIDGSALEGGTLKIPARQTIIFTKN